MPAVVRLGDMSAGHCYPARANDSASPDVFVNGRGVHRQGDHWPTHCLHGNTEIIVDNENIKIKDLIKNFEGKTVKTRLENGQIIISSISDAFLAKQTNLLLKLWLDNNTFIICTPDHRIQLANGTYKEAQCLTENDIL